jgi:hypothetical protein
VTLFFRLCIMVSFVICVLPDEPAVVVAAKVNGVVRDLRRPLSLGDICPAADGVSAVNVELVLANTPDGKAV